jgi:prolipoprotein diacylglyceryltransferase
MIQMAGIPYRSFPEIPLGPVDVRVYGLAVAIGVLLGAWLMTRRNLRHGIPADVSQNLVIMLVAGGLVGARLAWVLPNLDRIVSPPDVVAVWDGGLTLSGGFLAAAVTIPYVTRRLTPDRRWRLLDGAALGMAVGLIFGRICCIAVVNIPGAYDLTVLGLTGAQYVMLFGVGCWCAPTVRVMTIVCRT